MPTCPRCGADVAGQRFCGGCGAPADVDTDVTRTSARTYSSTTDPSSDERFAPGTVLAGRYRIVGPLGRGGMGEVYRADDLKLGQSVALKFLPAELERDAPRRARLFNEVKLARQVSHPNVCRVYDVGELEGKPFISMEYVDGEDLASLLRRIGRLPAEKGLEAARQICAGLAAAHEQGILHRDLKPANVMIDGRGRVKITDFGLAGLAEAIDGDEVRNGTPAYMAPEQLAGREVSVRSDLYALGLVLYELVTGKQAFAGKTPAEIARKQQETQPTMPSTIVSDLDEATERVILRCLERDPADRPGSALAVAAALPGGDPLAAALAAGETPSPELVAEAGEAGGLKPVWALALLAVSLAGLGLRALGPDSLVDRVPFDKSAAELTVQARDVLREVGYDDLDRPHIAGFSVDSDYLTWIRDNDDSKHRWDRLESARPIPLWFYYRTSPAQPKAVSIHAYRDDAWDPPPTDSGDVTVWTDTLGRLALFRALPDETGDPRVTFDWNRAFEAAGIDPASAVPAEVVKAPETAAVELRAWSLPAETYGVPVTLQMGAVADRLTYFEVVGPWNSAGAQAARRASAVGGAGGWFFILMILTALILAIRNARAGRSDTRGAFRLVLFTLVTMLLAALLSGLRLKGLDLQETFFSFTFGRPLGHALAHAAFIWMLYTALEPYARRIWPHILVSWTRLLRGRFRDPLLGRDILFGFAAGVVMSGLSVLTFHLVRAGGLDVVPVPGSRFLHLGTLGPREVVAEIFNGIQNAAYLPLGLTVILMVFRLIVRRNWATILAFALVFGPLVTLANPNLRSADPLIVAVAVVMSVGGAALLASIVVRGGLIALMSAFFFLNLDSLPLTFDFSVWYAGSSLTTIAIFAGIAGWAFYISLAGRPVFKDSLALDPC